MHQGILDKAFNISAPRNIRLALSLLFIMLATVVIMTGFQLVKHLIHPDMSMWESHIYTNLFAAIIAPLIALFVLLRFEGLYRKVSEENEERKKTEKALKDNQVLLRAVTDGSPDPIFIKDRESKILFGNPALLRVLGKTLDEVVGKNDHELFADTAIGDAIMANDRQVLRSNTSIMVEEVIQTPEGTRTYLSTKTPYYNGNNEIIGVLGIARDISEMKRKEEEVKAARSKAELYLDLMGHDINNMHQVALGYLEIVLDQPPEGRVNELIEKPIEVLNRSSRLIKNVMKLQKHSDRTYADRDINVCRVLADVQSENSAVGKKITMNLNGHDRCLIRSNELLHDVFTNLLGNAIKHTEEGTEITVSLEDIEDNDSKYCRVAVEDNGPGIPDDLKEKIFNRMQKGTTRGMGLGLYLVKTLVDSYGGRVWVEDRVRGDHTKGARFVVKLPVIEW